MDASVGGSFFSLIVSHRFSAAISVVNAHPTSVSLALVQQVLAGALSPYFSVSYIWALRRVIFSFAFQICLPFTRPRILSIDSLAFLCSRGPGSLSRFFNALIPAK
jgi:hypothetical protein